MIWKALHLSFSFIWLALPLLAQKPFTEGKIVYQVKITGPDHKSYSGTYFFTFKENNLRKEINLPNYQEIMLINTAKNTVYTLKNVNSKKFAIQLSLAEIQNSQAPYNGFTLNERAGKARKIAGYNCSRGMVTYKDGAETEVYFTRDIYAEIPLTFERFPDARFLPLSFFYKAADGTLMEFSADQVLPTGIENASFAIPRDYKMISYSEYKDMK